MLKHLKFGSSVLYRDFVQSLMVKDSYSSTHFCPFLTVDHCNPLALGLHNKYDFIWILIS